MEGAEKYHREIDLTGDSSVAQLIRWIKPQSKVLEMGPATGVMTHALKEIRQCDVTCVEVDAKAAERALPFCTRMLVEDLNLDRWHEQLCDERFDYITFADVLEHLVDPTQTLAKALTLLKPGGEVLISLPNIGYSGVVAELLQGHFEYRRDGVLDETHLRFFTRQSVNHLLKKTGLVALEWSRTVLPPERSEFRLQLRDLSRRYQSLLKAIPDGDTYQFLVRASTSGAPAISAVPAASETSAQVFCAQVFFDTGAGFSEELSSIVPIATTEKSASIIIACPAGLRSLRIDPVDCREPVVIRSITVTSDNQEIFSWTPARGALASVGRLANTAEVLFSSFSLLLPANEDPLIILPVALTNTGEIEICLSLSIEASLSDGVLMLHQAIADRDESIRQREQVIMDRDQMLIDKERRLSEQLLEAQDHRSGMERALAAERSRVLALSTQQQMLINSRSWKLTRPLRVVKGLGRVIKRALLARFGKARLRQDFLSTRGHDAGTVKRLLLRTLGAISVYEALNMRRKACTQAAVLNLSYQPLVSIIVVTDRTNPRLLQQCLESIRAQVYPKWEALIMDAASDSPAVRSILAAFSEADSRLKVQFIPSPCTVSQVRMNGLQVASGDIVTVLGHEDLLDETAVLKVVQKMGEDAALDTVFASEDVALRDGGLAAYSHGDSRSVWMRTSRARERGNVPCEIQSDDNAIHLAEVLYHRRAT
jgi:2-polyprenyl-3-methyl-5-hydroxy-6-metoxy-1,4-benzoquinol methylase